MSYLLYLPKEYAASQDKKPMFIFLCGNGHQGTDLNGIFNEGPASYLSNDKSLRDTVRFIGFFPQPPPNTRWDTPGMAAAVAALIPKIEEAYRVDPDRVYLTGLSMGGKGTWLVSQENPNLFAAIAPISAVAVNPETAGPRLKNLPAWIICGSDDGDFTAGSKKMTEILKQAGDDVTLEVREHEGHGVWGHYYAAHQFYDRLLTWKRIPAAAQAAATQAAQ
jgi:predicted peptidase